MFSFIHTLSESRLFPSQHHIGQRTAREMADLSHAMLCALRILLADPATMEWARDYAHRSAQYGSFDLWRSNGTDLYLAIHALVSGMTFHRDPSGDPEFRHDMPIDTALLVRWMREGHSGHLTEEMTRRLFVRLDGWFAIQESNQRSVRRIVMDWYRTDRWGQSLAVTRLLQILRRLGPTGEVYLKLRQLAARRDLEIAGAHDPSQGRYVVLSRVAENASAGSTSAASVASTPGGIGTGFDPRGDWRSIYPKKRKTMMIRRVAEATDPRSKYRRGMCDVMAIALSKITGLPYGLWRGFYDDDGEEAYIDAHACVIANGKRDWIDVDGLHSGEPPGLYFGRPVTRIELVDVGINELESAFTMEEIDAADIAEAVDFINGDTMLSNLVAPYAAKRARK